MVDALGNEIALRCVNWYGAHLEKAVAGGLNVHTVGMVVQRILEMGAFNCVRFVYSLDMVYGNVPLGIVDGADDVRAPSRNPLAANPQLMHMTLLQVFDACI